MPTTEITKTPTPKQYSQTGQLMTMVAADVANGNHLIATSNILLLARNVGVSSATITITSQPDAFYGRTGDVDAEAIAAGNLQVFRLTATGWADESTSEIAINCSSADIELGWMDLSNPD